MAIDNDELQSEKKYLESVKKILRKLIKEGNSIVDDSKEMINESKRFIWDNGADYTDEEKVLIMNEVDQSVDRINLKIDAIARYEKALQSPYFGEITFIDDEYPEEFKIYIGITNVEDKMEFYVFDWRSPIASMFYNYELGRAKYDAPNGEIKGEITSKMQFKIVNGDLIRCFKSDINIDDEYLQEILANSSTEKMKNIVSTIQREQNEIIRNSKDKYLIVQGVAGSGKTSVALHRIAFLLYKDISLTSNNILIFSPSDVFSDYISDVLPELGEQNVLKTTFSDFAISFLKISKNVENYSQFLERMYNQDINKEVAQYKMSNQYKRDIDEYLLYLENNIKFDSCIVANNREISIAKLKNLFGTKYAKFPLKERIDLIVEEICGDLKIPKKKNFNIIKNKLLSISNIELDFYKIYDDFLHSDFCKYKSNFDKKNKVYYEDITGLLYIYFQLYGYPNYSNIRQVVIDEAQDYTYFQMEIIKRIFKNSSFTILGDVNQTINPLYDYESLVLLSDIFANSRYLELSKTYRSSQEIIEYSNRILNLNNVCSVRRNVNIPIDIKIVEEDEMDTLKNDIEEMNSMGIKKIAIITKNVLDAKKLFMQLKDYKSLDIQLVSSSDESVNKPVIIIPVYLAKGLEFDGVIVFNNIENNYTLEEKNLFYVACTRAQHKLNVYNEPSKLLQKK